MYWDKRGILKIYNFCRRGRQGLAARSAALVKGGILLVEENTPFGTPRDNEGTPLDPALSVPARNHCTRCAKNCLRFPVAAFDLVCVYVRSAAAAAGLRKASAFGDTAFLREKAVRKRARGRRPLTPELRQSNYRSAAVCKCTGAAQPRLLPLSIWCASCGRCRSAAGLRRRFIPSPLGKPARLYKIRSPAAASRRSTAHTAHRLSYPRHTFSFCTAQHNAHIQVPYTASTISHSAAEKICSPHSPCTFLRFSISVIVTITLRLWKVNLSFVKMFASC